MSSSHRGFRSRGFARRIGRGHSGERRLDGNADSEQILELPAIQIIDLPRDGANTKEEDIYVSDVKSLGSYNRMDEWTLTIVVPGHPRIWLDRSMPYNVPPDVGPPSHGNARCKFEHFVMFPLFVAVDRLVQDEGRDPVDWPSVDFVTDRNNLRKLLRWILGKDDHKTFRIDLQLAGDRTVIMAIWAGDQHRRPILYQRTQQRRNGYGFNFEKESTKSYPGLERSLEYDRVIQYNMSGLNLVVRFEVDGCILPTEGNSGSSGSGEGPSVLSAESELSEQLSSMHLSTPAPPSLTRSFNVVGGGASVPESCILEVTTAKNVHWEEQYPQIFFSQTPHHISAQHVESYFYAMDRTHISSPKLQAVNKKLQPELKKLRRFLGHLQELVILHGKGQRLSLVYGGDKKMRLFRMKNDVCCVPEEFLTRFSTTT
ncbi:hypothetical protein BDN72DRAFT_629096 [Pluteus cervinus]|uniref:Uncharacterized protein n=1 Tax=Pluteus cervinus TaxID=181527 RepID=A0ACD3BA67_9AGAR|nr:hypothetical protein BDN72DRAFT_629096 [Pluteus cervinus]